MGRTASGRDESARGAKRLVGAVDEPAPRARIVPRDTPVVPTAMSPRPTGTKGVILSTYGRAGQPLIDGLSTAPVLRIADDQIKKPEIIGRAARVKRL